MNPKSTPETSKHEISSSLKQFGITEADLAFFHQKNKPLEQVAAELKFLSSDPTYPAIVSPALMDNSFMLPLDLDEFNNLLGYFKATVINQNLQFVVPTAGAASRQVSLLKTLLNHPLFSESATPDMIHLQADSAVKELSSERRPTDSQKAALSSLREVSNDVLRFWNEGVVNKKYAFWYELKAAMASNGVSLEEAIEKRDIKTVSRFIIGSEGINYAKMPKALMRVHSYENGTNTPECRLVMEEHLREASLLLKGASLLRIHFLISEEHQTYATKALENLWTKEGFVEFIKQQGFSRDNIEVTWGYQASSTDSVSLDLTSKQLVRDAQGQPLLRKAGHGCLLPNLSNLNSEGIWLQNVDNVLYDNPLIKRMVIMYKQAMAALAKREEARIHNFVSRLDSVIHQDTSDPSLNAQIIKYLDNTLLMTISDPSLKDKAAIDVARTLRAILDRPLVVAGYVPLERGQAGGGPFVIETELGGTRVQKVNTLEQSEFPGGSENTTFQSGTFFNPVLYFLAKKAASGAAHDLSICADQSRAFRSLKPAENGNIISAYERPGLWNGSLAKALQISIPVPSSTFSAIKTLAGKESFLARLHGKYDGPAITELDLDRGVLDRNFAEFLNT
jgi:Domain of unknown function (DUF4301)